MVNNLVVYNDNDHDNNNDDNDQHLWKTASTFQRNLKLFLVYDYILITLR